MKTRLLTTTLLAASLLASPAMAATTTANFVKNASIGNMFEVQTSELALEKTQDGHLREFAEHMIQDHGKTGDELKTTLEASNTKLEPATKLDAAHQKKLDDLKNAEGEDFEKKYIKAQQDAHKEAVTLFKDYAKTGDNKSLKEFAANTLPTLEQHKSKVQTLGK